MASSTRQDTEEEARPSSSMHAKVLHTLPRWLGCCEVRFNNRQQVVSYTIHTTASVQLSLAAICIAEIE
jgi:hypothetical protein